MTLTIIMFVLYIVEYTGNVVVDEAPIIRFENVTCYTPKSRTLIKNLSFTVDVDTNLLIMGPSGKNTSEFSLNKPLLIILKGSGKSSILRVLNEIWPYFNGIIYDTITILIMPFIRYYYQTWS